MDDNYVISCLIELKNEIEKLPFNDRDIPLKNFHRDLIDYFIDEKIYINHKGILLWHSAGSLKIYEIQIFERDNKAFVHKQKGLKPEDEEIELYKIDGSTIIYGE